MEYFYKALDGCSLAGFNELDYNVDFGDVHIENDWNKYPGSIVDLDKNDPNGSPMGIFVDDTPITQIEVVENTMKILENVNKIVKDDVCERRIL